jgi:hypothetical protein
VSLIFGLFQVSCRHYSNSSHLAFKGQRLRISESDMQIGKQDKRVDTHHHLTSGNNNRKWSSLSVSEHSTALNPSIHKENFGCLIVTIRNQVNDGTPWPGGLFRKSDTVKRFCFAGTGQGRESMMVFADRGRARLLLFPPVTRTLLFSLRCGLGSRPNGYLTMLGASHRRFLWH